MKKKKTNTKSAQSHKNATNYISLTLSIPPECKIQLIQLIPANSRQYCHFHNFNQCLTVDMSLPVSLLSISCVVLLCLQVMPQQCMLGEAHQCKLNYSPRPRRKSGGQMFCTMCKLWSQDLEIQIRWNHWNKLLQEQSHPELLQAQNKTRWACVSVFVFYHPHKWIHFIGNNKQTNLPQSPGVLG